MTEATPSDQDIPGSWSWFQAARLADLAPGAGHEVTHQGRVYALFRVGEQVFGLDGLCPHQKARLAAGVVDLDRLTITCPRQGCLRWRFDLASGASAAGLTVACPVYPVRISDGEVFVAVPT